MRKVTCSYYNEWDAHAAAWLRELIRCKLIPYGDVDERSITEVTASDLEGYTQCHFFAGIGGWPLALQIAGVPETVPLWTGSPPCQPFSVAGAGKGKNDPRHLAPAFLDLVADCRPALLFGEQVAAAVAKDFWIDSLLIELEEEGYTCGFSVLPACGVGAPHKRDRLFFGAVADRHDNRQQSSGGGSRSGQCASEGDDVGRGGAVSCMADTNDTRPQGRQGMPECTDQQPFGPRSMESGLVHADNQHISATGYGKGDTDVCRAGKTPHATDTYNSFWSDADWLGCRDGKFRPVEPGTFPLANGIPARVGRLRGYGNAIVPQVAAEFINAFIEANHHEQKATLPPLPGGAN